MSAPARVGPHSTSTSLICLSARRRRRARGSTRPGSVAAVARIGPGSGSDLTGITGHDHFGSGRPETGRTLACHRGAPGCDEHRGGGGEEGRAGRRPESGIEHDPEEAVRIGRGFRSRAGVPPRELRRTQGEAGVVGKHRADAGQEGARLRPPSLDVAAGRLSGNPSARPVREGGAGVEARGELQPYEGPAGPGAHEESGVEVGRGSRDPRAVRGLRLHPGLPQALEAPARDSRVRVPDGGHHPGHTGLDERGRTRRRPSGVAARFEGDVGGRAPRHRSRGREGACLGMGFARPPVPAFSDDLPVPYQHASDPGVRVGGEEPATREGERALEELAVGHCLLPRSERKLRAARLRA